jgi:hypothetical protein
VSATYQSSYFNTLQTWVHAGTCMAPGETVDECKAILDEYHVENDPILAAFQSHLTYLKQHPAPRCLVDAYAADSNVTQSVVSWMASPNRLDTAGDTTPEGRGAVLAFNTLMGHVDAFEQNFAGYVSDCG